MSKRSGFILLGIVIVFWVHFFLRAHQPTQQAFFIDEHRHIERAAAIWDGTHPAAQSHGKFLLYVWLAPFKSDRTIALHISRSAVGLFSLIGAAALYALMRRLFGMSIAFVSIVFYAFVPFAVFYERMVLADGIAAVFGMLTAWQSIRLAFKPTYGRGIMVGLMAALAVMAKLTMTFSTVLMPVMAVLLFGNHVSQSASQLDNRWQWFKARFWHYWWYLFAAGCAFIVAWLPTLIPGAIVAVTSRDYFVLVDQSLIDTTVLTGNGRYAEFFNQIEMMLWLPMILVLISSVGLGLWKLPRYTLFALGWLLLIWLPNLLIVWQTKTRYYMPGMYAVAMLLGIGIVALSRIHWDSLLKLRINQKRFAQVLVSGFMLIWILLFAFPFDRTASTDAGSLDMPLFDRRDYFQQPWNAYGLLPSLNYVKDNGMDGADGKIHVVGINWLCSRLELYDFGNVELECLENEYDGSPDDEQWQAVVDRVEDRSLLYLVLEQHRNTLEIPEIPYANPQIAWQEIARFQRPMNGLWVTVWEARMIIETGSN